MKKVLTVLVAAVGLTTVSVAQKGTTKVAVAAEVGLPNGDFGDGFKTGFGGSVKGLFGIGQAGQVTFTSGYSSFTAKGSTSDMKLTMSIIPILAVYRHNFSGLYVEPQIGYGIYGAKLKTPEGSDSDSDGAFTWAFGAGYVYQNFELGVRYQSASKDGDNLSMVGIRLGYNFSLGGSSSK